MLLSDKADLSNPALTCLRLESKSTSSGPGWVTSVWTRRTVMLRSTFGLRKLLLPCALHLINPRRHPSKQTLGTGTSTC